MSVDTRSTKYQAHRERAAQRAAKLSESGRDIGPLPKVVNPDRKEAARLSLRLFCESYMPATFPLAWSDDHLEVIAAIEAAALRGELLAFAMPRGSGKTTLVEAGTVWTTAYGHREFVAIIGSDEGHAATMLQSVQIEWETNELLLEDFPEVAYPIACLERIHNRARGQLFGGNPTHIRWTADELQLPTIPGSPASGAIVRVAGITGAIRGMSAKRASDGRKMRPDMVLIDDPQTDESARSPSQVAAREAVVNGAILGLAGPGKRIAGAATVTVIARDDLADRLLNRDRHPAWQGRRFQMVYEWPTEKALWDQYAELRRRGQREGVGTAKADEFYATNRDLMDAGAVVGWPARKNDDELSAIQHAWNLRIDRGEHAFQAEFQNEPLATMDNVLNVLSVDAILKKRNGYMKAIVPAHATRLTAFIDVQQTILYWMVCAWQDDFSGAIIDYGTHPDQARAYFTMRDAQRTIQLEHRETAFEACMYAALDRCVSTLLGREYKHGDGTGMRIERLLIDAGWGKSTDIVYQFCRSTPFAGIVMPSHGRGVGASSMPFNEWSRHPGDRIGPNWRVPANAGKRSVRHCLFDTNFWKTFAASRFLTAIGEPGCLTLFGYTDHGLLCDHVMSEAPVRTEARGRVVDEWKTRSVGQDNHWWDCLIGCHVAASMQGVRTIGAEATMGARKRYGPGSGGAAPSAPTGAPRAGRKSYGSGKVEGDGRPPVGWRRR